MPELLTAEQLSLADKATTFAREVLLPLVESTTADEVASARRQITRESKAAGLYTMTQGDAVGADNVTALDLTIVRDALASMNAPFIGAVFGPGPGVLGGVHYLSKDKDGE